MKTDWISKHEGGRVSLLAILFVLVLFLNTQNNQFNWAYHNDEPSKVDQIQTGERNLRHPPLMLTLTSVAVHTFSLQDNAQAIAETGRWLSALCMALALVLLAKFLWSYVHPTAAIAWAGVAPFQADLFEVGHYFKEDAIFLLGLAWVLNSFFCYIKKQTIYSAIILGLALAFAAGTKYVGALLLIPVAIYIFLNYRNDSVFKRLIVMAFLGGLVVIFAPALVRLTTWSLFLKEETSLLFTGDYGTGLAVPHYLYFKQLGDIFSWPLICIGSGLFLVGSFFLKKKGFWIFPVVVLATLMLLAFTSKYSERYLLPVTFMVLMMLISGPLLALKALLRGRWEGRHRNLICSLVSILTAAIVLSILYPNFQQRWHSFQADSRKELSNWVKINLASLPKSDLKIAQDTLAKFYEPDLSASIWESYFVADLGSIKDLQTKGITHVIISFDVYHRYVDQNTFQSESKQSEYQRRAQFYQTLLREGKILWSSEPRNPKALHPGLKLIDITGIR